MLLFLKHKNKLIILISTIMILTIVFGIYILHTTFININYSKSQAHVIALNKFPGTIIASDIDYDDLQIYYDLEIINSNQEIIDVVISAKTGDIVGYEYGEG